LTEDDLATLQQLERAERANHPSTCARVEGINRKWLTLARKYTQAPSGSDISPGDLYRAAWDKSKALSLWADTPATLIELQELNKTLELLVPDLISRYNMCAFVYCLLAR